MEGIELMKFGKAESFGVSEEAVAGKKARVFVRAYSLSLSLSLIFKWCHQESLPVLLTQSGRQGTGDILTLTPKLPLTFASLLHF